MSGRICASKADRAQLTRNAFGGVIVCQDRDLLMEEAPEAYKSIDPVIADLADFGLARVVATFRALVTFKTARSAANMVEIEIGALRSQCLDRSIDSKERLVSGIAAWECQRNASRVRIKWMFTTEKAHAKMGRAYPKLPIKES
jgi:hypothetical protein